MSPHSSPVAGAHRRMRILHALGIQPWVRRGTTAGAAVAGPDAAATGSAAADSSTVLCVVVLPEGCSVRELDLLGRALSSGGAALARAARLSVSGGQIVGAIPEARAYLVFGEAQAHALGRSLPAAVLHQAQIVLADEPAQVLSRADAKRRLWSALRSVRRVLASTGS
ncbi:MAG: hypothetical protein EPN74_13425 [Rhodanobacter sp.]|nr:MAG: hypothetical protein EPN74_13425 [Rhodanobacter sp.]